MTIRVTNKYKGGQGIYIGRPSIFGNRFRIQGKGPEARAEAIAKHKEWLNSLDKYHPLIQQLQHLADQYSVTGQLELTCFCAPKPCHGDNLAEKIYELAKRYNT